MKSIKLMRQISLGYYLKLLLLCGVFVFGGASVVLANSQSDNFEATETEFGAGAAIEACSGEYCAQATIGDMSAGNEAATTPTSTASFGPYAEDGEPMTEVIIEDGVSNLGVLKTDSTASKTTIIKIRSYRTDGYTLQIVGDPPQYAGHTMSTPENSIESSPGQEQFAVNAVANTSPAVGADPKQVPDPEFSFGQVEADYATTNLFKYQSGSVVARSNSESGQTEYTISMIVNVAGSTPAGHYVADLSAIVVPAF